ncbi:broad specificity phosphatase PhoE [Rhizobium sp. BK376]|nr:broad specificity phosphatase PhoE [Rhizobium sp. BK376]
MSTKRRDTSFELSDLFSGEISAVKGRLTWICHGATQSNRDGAFPTDEPLEERAVEQSKRLVPGLSRPYRVWISPMLRARQTAELLALQGEIEPALGECDYGRWAGKGLADIHASEPDGLSVWMTNADAAPHDGESLSHLRDRVGAWMERHLGDGGHTVVVTHASVIRAAIIHVLRAPPEAFWKIDVEPLSLTEVSSDGRRWTLRLPNRARSD